MELLTKLIPGPPDNGRAVHKSAACKHLGLCDTKGLSLIGKHVLHVKQSKHEGACRLQGLNMA